MTKNRQFCAIVSACLAFTASSCMDSSGGPPSKEAQVPSARCWDRIQRAAC